ncbi:MAG: UvrD-helicase domain-containing protein [Clostridiales bacterium]|nr:UvrD-helicase domain-containing protein [Clostridiales bacterium]
MADVKWTKYQKNAIDASSCSIAVSAAAGSGKTAVLTTRIIEHIKAGGDLKTMLIVTFTNAAAQQLKDKIASALNESLYDRSLSQTGKRHIQRQLIALPNAKISTIDSFIISLVRENFTEAGIPIGSGVMDEAVKTQLETDVAEMLIQDYFEGKVSGEDRHIEDFDNFANVFGDPLSVPALAENLMYIKGFYDTQPDPYQSIIGEREDCSFEESEFGRILFSYTESAMVHYRNIFAECQKLFAEEKIEKNVAVFKELEDYCNLVIVAAKDADKPYEKVKKTLETYKVGSLSKKDTPVNLEKYLKYKDDFRDLITNFKNTYYSFTAEEIEDAKEKIEEQKRNLVAFLKEYDERLFNQKSLRRMFSFNDYERLGLKILTEPDLITPSVLCARLKSYFSEIYIDEYQDTNSLQDRIFNLLSREDNLFTVGDIKQSIYGFRGAEPSIFDKQIKERPEYDKQKPSQKTKIYLSDNFRSTYEIIDAVNCVFDNVLKTDPVISYGPDDRLRCGKKVNGPKPELLIIHEEGKSAEELRDCELKYIAKRIIEEKKNNPELKYSDFAILSRKGEISSLAANILSSFDIPSVDKNAKQFFNNPEVMLVMALFKCIDNPYSDIYLTSIMKSPLYGFTLDDQIKFRMTHDERPLYLAVKKCAESEDKWSKRCKKLISDLEQYKPLSRVLSCFEFVKEIYEGMMLTSIVSISEGVEREEAARANLIQLYDYARSFDSRKSKSLSDFLEYIDQLISNENKIDMSKFTSSDDAVQIATIHGSKGLQYKYVFMPCLSAVSKSVGGSNYILSRKLPISLMPVAGDERVDNIFYRISLLNEKMTESDETLRVLYVGLTRPETYLIMSASTGKAKDKIHEEYDICSDNCNALFEAKNMSYYSRIKMRSFFELLIKGFSIDPSVIDFSIIPVSETTEEHEETFETENKVEELSNEEELRELFKKRFNFVYPYENLIEIPNKLSVSKMYPDLLDQPEEGYSPEQLEIEEKDDRKRTEIVPQFISGETEVTPREQGISVHLFMQFFDLENVYRNGIDNEIERLHNDKYIYDETYRIIKFPWNRKKIENFFKSSLALDMKNAKVILREKKFTLNFPAESFTKDKEKAESIKGIPLLVQGVIDCLYVNNKDELILVDYKTDHFAKTVDRTTVEETLKGRYNNQLMYYAYAAEKIMHKKVAHIRLYSFAIDDIIELERKDVFAHE